jgi:hypothetical protein
MAGYGAAGGGFDRKGALGGAYTRLHP